MTDIRQSPVFASFMKNLGWQVEKDKNTYLYLRKFPFIGYFVKIPRPQFPLSFGFIKKLSKKYRIFQIKISPFLKNLDTSVPLIKKQFKDQHFRIENFPFNPTTTIHINLKRSETEIFNSFTSAKRRAVRRAQKNGIRVLNSDNIEAFINIRKQQYFPLGILVVNEMQKLWQSFFPTNASLLLAYPSWTHIKTTASICVQKPLAGILLLYWEETAYYWFASALPYGKKLFAPTLLVWEALKLAKKKGYQMFDFEGICDDRFPKASKSWKGFTKFKEGFGGKKVVYIENFIR